MESIHFWEMLAAVIVGIITLGTVIWKVGRMVEKNKNSLSTICPNEEICVNQPHAIRHEERLRHLEKDMLKLEDRWVAGHAAVMASHDKLRDLVADIAGNVKMVTEKVNEFIRVFEREKGQPGGMRG